MNLPVCITEVRIGDGKDRGAAEGGDSGKESQAGAQKPALAPQQVFSCLAFEVIKRAGVYFWSGAKGLGRRASLW